MVEHTSPAEFYDSRPWKDEYGPGISPELVPLPYKNLGELVRQACIEYAAKTAFTICLDNGMTASLKYHKVDVLSDQFAAYLRHELKLQPEDRVAIQLPNCLSYPVAAFGIFKAGCVLVNVNPLYTADEMNHQLKDSGAKVLLIIDMFANKLGQALRGTNVEKVLLVSIAEFFPKLTGALVKTVLKLKKQIPAPTAPAETFASALAAGKRHLKAAGPVPNDRGRDDLAVLQYTGGTTGVAKGAMLTHGNLLSNLAQSLTVAGDVNRPGEEVVLTALPLYHIFAFTYNLLSFFQIGGHNILIPSPRPVSNLKPAFEKFQITRASGVNVLFAGLLREEWFRTNPPRHLEITISGGTALHSAIAEEWQKVVGGKILEGYGLSETSPTLAVNPIKGENRIGTIGIPMPSTEIRIVDEQGNPVPPGQPGELVARGPQVFKGYWNRPEETEAAMRDGWFHTGDIAIMDERGYLRIVDRKKDLIDVSGFNVYPNEVEDCIARIPAVAEVAVIGVPLPEGGERVRAYVVSTDPNLTEEDVIKHCRQHLTAYKVPKEVIFREELPKTPVGKVLRKDLRAEVLREIGKT
ncbi:MAG: AMP-binding protein [Xanthomonadaceae bacterium]|nr:AMP-binding protein [Xanthomonadaceae bacterium]